MLNEISVLSRTRYFIDESPSVARKQCVETHNKLDSKHSVFSLSPVSLSVSSLVPDLLFDCSRVLEYAKIRTVLQSNNKLETIFSLFLYLANKGLQRTG